MGPAHKDALAHLRVVDFSWAASGPLATLHLALHGAQVIKIESAKSLDLARRGYYTAVEDLNASPNFNDMHLNKLSVRLNLGHPKAQALAKRLIARSDVVVENFRPGVMERFGLGYAALQAVKPDIVMLSASASGQTGPERHLPGYATVFGALGGLSYVTGHEAGPATELWDSIDMRLGTAIALAVTFGVFHQRRRGQGQHIDLSSREVISSLLGDMFFDYQMNARVPGRRGNRDDIMAPHNCYPCRGVDRWISIAVETDEEWSALCAIAGHPEWAENVRFSDKYGRWKWQEEIDSLLSAWTRGEDATELTQRLQRAGVPAMPSMDTSELAADPHMKAREAFMNVPHPVLGETFPVRSPWLLSETPARSTRHAPNFGEHSDVILGDLLGVSAAEQRALQREGVLE